MDDPPQHGDRELIAQYHYRELARSELMVFRSYDGQRAVDFVRRLAGFNG